MMRVFIGYDARAPRAYNVMAHSIVRHASKPVAITALRSDQLPISRFGLTEFTFSRFLVPWLCDYQGHALFVDPDMVVVDDIVDLFRHAEDAVSVQVNKNQPVFEWPSAMLFNNARCTVLTPEWVNDTANDPFKFSQWAESVGSLPPEWNHCVGYMQPNAQAKLLHYTCGVPGFHEINMLPLEGNEKWHREAAAADHLCSWCELMGKSVHAEGVIKGMLQHYAGE